LRLDSFQTIEKRASTVSSRGVYKFPVERKAGAKYDDHQSSSYDVEHCSWSDLPEDNFILSEDLPYDMGEFVWTGFDYLGEPTPYYDDWPSHSSLFGIIDLAYLPKDRYYLYRSQWNKAAETLHIFRKTRPTITNASIQKLKKKISKFVLFLKYFC
jgi:beta-galactosidase